jgi:dephospho-CoA kinase
MLKSKYNKKLNINSSDPNIRVAITGGIGSGKSFLLDCFDKLGFLTLDADKTVHNLFQKGNPGYEEIGKIFPEAKSDEGIDRAILSKIILNNPKALKTIEQAIHPLVRQQQDKFAHNNPGKTIIYEIPLLFENDLHEDYDIVISAFAPLNIRKDRALTRKGMTEAKFNAIVQKQVSDYERRQKSDIIIDTSKSKEECFNQIKSIVE